MTQFLWVIWLKLFSVSNEVHIKNVPARQEDNTKGSEFGDDLLGISEQGNKISLIK